MDSEPQRNISGARVIQSPMATGSMDARVIDLNFEVVMNSQRNDKDLREVLEWLEKENNRPTWEDVSSKSKELKFWWARYELLIISRNILCIRWEAARPTDQAQLKMILPPDLRPRIMEHFHDNKTAGHLGIAKTFSKLCRGQFYWPAMRQYSRRWVQNCKQCQRRKQPG